MNGVADRIFQQFGDDGGSVRPDGRYGEGGTGFGWGTVHHGAGSLLMA